MIQDFHQPVRWPATGTPTRQPSTGLHLNPSSSEAAHNFSAKPSRVTTGTLLAREVFQLRATAIPIRGLAGR